MSSCTWMKKRKGVVVETCGTLAQEGSAFCPRHTFLYNMEQKQQDESEAAKRALGEHKAFGRFPRTRLQHCAAGYVFQGSDTCRCGNRIEWWRTPNLKNAPYDPMPEETSIAVSHFATCRLASSFRRAS